MVFGTHPSEEVDEDVLCRQQHDWRSYGRKKVTVGGVLWEKGLPCFACQSKLLQFTYYLYLFIWFSLHVFFLPCLKSHSNWIYACSLIQETLCCNVLVSQTEVFSFYGELAFSQFMPGILVINCTTSFLIIGLNSPVQKCTTLRPCPSFALVKQYSWSIFPHTN